MGINNILESFKLNGIEDILYENMDLVSYNEGALFLEEIYYEASNGMTKENVLQKIWNFIKKCFAWIVNMVKKLVGFIKRTITGKSRGNGTSASSIASEIVGDKNLNKPTNNDSNKITVDIPSNPNSEVKMDDKIDMIYQSVYVDVNKNNITFKIPSNLAIIATALLDGKAFKGENIPDMKYGSINLEGGMKMIIDESYFNGFIKMSDYCVNIMNMLSNIDLNNNKDIIKIELEINDFYNLYKKYNLSTAKLPDYSKYEITIERFEHVSSELANTYKKISDIHDINSIINKINDIGSLKYKYNDFIIMLNNYTVYLSIMQMTLNTISISLSNMLVVDARYKGSISNINDLSKFIDKCIYNGIPSKYIAYNAYLISDESIHGKDSSKNEKNPSWGQSRVVFFPDESKVYKIALNGMGVDANKVENKITDILKSDKKLLKYITPIFNSYNDSVIVSAEKVDARKGLVSDNDAEAVARKLNDALEKLNMKSISVSDIHTENCGIRRSDGSNQVCIIDYGSIGYDNKFAK